MINSDLVSLRAAADENDLKKFKSVLDGINRLKLRGKEASEIARVAASHGYLDIIQCMAETKPSVLDEKAYFASASMAAQKGHPNVVRYLVEKEPSLVTELGLHPDVRSLVTLANIAAENHHPDILLYLAVKEATTRPEREKSNNYHRDNRNALELAIEENILDEKTLKTLGPFPRSGQSICHLAAKHGNLDVMRYFVERDPTLLSKLENIAHVAAHHSQWNVLEYVVDKDPSLLMKQDRRGTIPLFLAVKNNGVSIAKLESLIQENKVQLDETDRDRNTIVDVAAETGNLDMITFIDQTLPSILEKQVLIYQGSGVAGRAAANGHWEIVRYLAKKNPSVYTEAVGRRHFLSRHDAHVSILYVAISEKSLDQKTLKFLLETQNVPLNLRECHEGFGRGNLAQLCIENEDPDMFHYLVQKEPSLLSDKIEGLGTVAHLAAQKAKVERENRNHYLTEKIMSTAVEKTPSLFAQKDDVKGNSFLRVAVDLRLINVETLEKLVIGKFVTLTDINNAGDTLAHAVASAAEFATEEETYGDAFEGDMFISTENTEDSYEYSYGCRRQGRSRNSYDLKRAQESQAKNSQIIAYLAKKQASLLTRKNNDGDTVAHIAAKTGQVFLLEDIARISPTLLQKTDRQQNNVLHLLAAKKALMTPSQFDALIGKGVPLMGTNRQGETVAHIAARNGLVRMVEYIIQKEPTVVTKKNNMGRTIAFTAAENARYSVIRCIENEKLLLDRDIFDNTIFHLILQCGAFNPPEFTGTFHNITIPTDLLVKPNREGLSAVYLAAQVGCADIIERVAQEKPSILVEQTPSGVSVLTHAIKHNQPWVVMTILTSNEKYEEQSIHALFEFSNENDVLNIIQSIQGIDAKTSERVDGVAIHCAIENGYWTVLKHFIDDRKVDVNQPNAAGEPLIFTAIRCKHYDMFEYLAGQPGINLAQTDHRGNNVLLIVMERGDDLHTLQYILDEKRAPIDVNWRNEAGDTILHRAVRNAIKSGEDYHSEIIHYLVEKKHANINVPGEGNKTVLVYAAENQRFDICNYLLDHGADPHYKDDTGKDFWELSHFNARRRRSAAEGVSLMSHHSFESPVDEYVPRVTDHTLGERGALFAGFFNPALSLSGFSVLAHVLLRSDRKGHRRQHNYPSSKHSPVEVVRAKMDPIALDAILENHWNGNHHQRTSSMMNQDLVALRVAAEKNDLKNFKSVLDCVNRLRLRGKEASEIAQLAASNGSLGIIQSIVEMKPAVLDGNAHFASACVAAEKGHQNVVQYLVEKEPSLVSKGRWNSDGSGPVTLAGIAAENRHLDILLYLAIKEATTFLEGDEADGWRHDDSINALNALQLAIKENILDEKTLETLGPVSRVGQSMCLTAAKQGNLDVVRYFVERDPSLLSKLMDAGLQKNIAQCAAHHSQWNVFCYIFEKDPSLLVKGHINGRSPLVYAIQNCGGVAQKLRHLVQKNEVQLGGSHLMGHTLAHVAAECGNLDVITLIDEMEPSIFGNEAKTYGCKIAQVAGTHGHWNIVRYLAKKNPSVYTVGVKLVYNNLSSKDCSLFYKAVHENTMDQETLQFLLETEKVPLNLRERHRRAPRGGNLAQLSIKNKNPRMFHYLVRKEPSLLSGKIKGVYRTVAQLAAQKTKCQEENRSGYYRGEPYLTKEIISMAVEKTPSLFAQKGGIKGNSFLHEVTELGLIDIDTLEKLLSGKFVTLTDINNEGDTLAHAAASAAVRIAENRCFQSTYEGDLFISSELIKKDDEYSDMCQIPHRCVSRFELEQAQKIQAKNSQIIAYLAKKQASLLALKNNAGDTIAHTAAKTGYAFVLEEIAEISPLLLQKTNHQQNNVLHLLAAKRVLMTPTQFDVFVEKGVPLMGTNYQGETVAHIAARNGLVRMVESIIQKEPTVVLKRNNAGRTIAFTAAENAHYAVIRCMPDKKLLWDTDNAGNTIFHLILQSGTFNTREFANTFQDIHIPIDLLIKPNINELSAVYLAAQVGCADIIERVAKEKPSILIEQTRSGDSVLAHAIRHNQLWIVMTILTSSEKYEAQVIQALFQSSNERDVLNIIQSIQGSDAKMSEQDRRNFDGIAIHCAIENGFWTVLKHFIEDKKVSVNQPDAAGQPPIFSAILCKHYDMFEYLAGQPGINLAQTDHRGNNVLFIAMERGDDLHTLQYVLNEKRAPIDVNWRNEAGDTILHRAVRNAIKSGEDYHSETIHYLVEKKHANTNAPGQGNKTVLVYAAEHRRFDICNYLLDHGADPHFKDDTGKDFWELSRFNERQRRGVHEGTSLMSYHSGESRVAYSLDQYVPRVTDYTQRASGAFFADYCSAPLSLSGFSTLAHVLLRRSIKSRRQYNHRSSDPLPVGVMYAEIDPIAVDAVSGNRWD